MDEQRYEYRTGDTQPRKNSNGIIALLLICVIFLTGVVSVLSLLNIRLFRALQEKQDTPPLSFSHSSQSTGIPEGDSLVFNGITFQALTGLYEEFYHLPHGLYVVTAPEDGLVLAGDVLVKFAASGVTTLTELGTLYAACQPGDAVELTFFRQGTHYTHTIIIE